MVTGRESSGTGHSGSRRVERLLLEKIRERGLVPEVSVRLAADGRVEWPTRKTDKMDTLAGGTGGCAFTADPRSTGATLA